MSNFFEKIKPWLSSIILLPVIIYYSINMGKFTFIDYINLLIHEGGHGIMRIFGDVIYTLGGTIMQLFIPALFVFYFSTNRKKFGIQLSLIWLGENFMNVAVYVSDARARRLPLLGGNNVYHDWTYLLGKFGMLEYDILLGNILFGCAFLIFIISFLMPIFMKDYSRADIKLNLD